MEPDKEVVDLSGACVAAVQNAVGVELDFTQDTLPVLDHYATLVGSPKTEVVSLLAPMCGAYFGEVLRRHLGDGRWIAPSADYSQWRLKFELCSLEINPIGVAVEVLTDSDAPDWGAVLWTDATERALVERALDVYGAVRALDYYTFGVRFEAVEQAHQALSRHTAGKRLN